MTKANLRASTGTKRAGLRNVAKPSKPAGVKPARKALSIADVAVHLRVEDVAIRFGMSKSQVAETAGLNPSVLYKSARLHAPKNQARIREMLEIIHRVSEWSGGKDQAMSWYRAEPIAAFGGRTAESLVKDGKAASIRDYLDSIAMGGFA